MCFIMSLSQRISAIHAELFEFERRLQGCQFPFSEVIEIDTTCNRNRRVIHENSAVMHEIIL